MCRWLRKCFAFTQINEDFLLVSAHLTPFSLECYIPLRLYRPVCYDMEGNDLETGKERESRRVVVGEEMKIAEILKLHFHHFHHTTHSHIQN